MMHKVQHYRVMHNGTAAQYNAQVNRHQSHGEKKEPEAMSLIQMVEKGVQTFLPRTYF
jgi:hypothetical protein